MTRGNSVYKNDWIGFKTVFYNEKALKVSENINEVIDLRDVQFDPEGLNNYLDFGYSVFGQTPIKNVKFLLPNQKLTIVGKKIKISILPDPVEKYLDKNFDEEGVWDLIKSRILSWETKAKGPIVIPTSGGYDSRLLNLLVEDRSRIRSFTYGVSEDQVESSEVVYAKSLAKVLGTKWQRIELGDFHKYLSLWDDLYGISTHAHGMYQIEFYEKLSKKLNGSGNILSGIIGDAWSGNVVIPPINNLADVNTIGYSHGISAGSDCSLLKSGDELKKEYFVKNKSRLIDPKLVLVESMRVKMILLSYLVKLPERYGLVTYSPFLDVEVAMAMLNLPSHRRKNRQWQRDFFKKRNTDFEDQGIKADFSNTLDLQAIIKRPLPELDVSIMSGVIKKEYLEEINRVIRRASLSLSIKRKVKNRFGVVTNLLGLNLYDLNCKEAVAYNAYMTLKPIESLMIKSQG